MPDQPLSRGAARAPEPKQGNSLTFSIAEEVEQLREEPYWQSGHNSKTIAHFDDLRVVLTAIKSGTDLHEHTTAGRLAVQTVEGNLRMKADGKTYELPAGHMAVLDRVVPYDIQAIEDGAFLLFVAWPQER